MGPCRPLAVKDLDLTLGTPNERVARRLGGRVRVILSSVPIVFSTPGRHRRRRNSACFPLLAFVRINGPPRKITLCAVSAHHASTGGPSIGSRGASPDIRRGGTRLRGSETYDRCTTKINICRIRISNTSLDMLSLVNLIPVPMFPSEAVFLLSVIGPVITYFFSSDDSDDTLTVTVWVVDEADGRTYRHATRVLARSNTERVVIDLTAGEGKVELKPGDWVFEVRQASQTIGQGRRTLNSNDESDHITLSVDPYVIEATVTGGPNRQPLGEATVKATPDAGERKMDKTDSEGRVQFEIPRSASTVSFTATYRDLPPVESEYQIEEAVQNGVTLAIAEGTGTMRVETTVAGQIRNVARIWPEVTVQIVPVSAEAKISTDEGTITTDSQGRRTIEEVPIGEYELSAHPRVDGVETTPATESVRVAADEMVEATLSIEVRYSLSEAQRGRLDDLRERIAALSDFPDRDMAIPRYYGTVLIAVLELVEAIAVAPERAGRAGTAPDAAVDALLDGTEMGLDIVADAMSERRVVSVCKACEAMPPAEVTWLGVTTLADFFHRVNTGTKSQRRALRNQLATTGEIIEEQRGEVNEVAPAKKLHGRVGRLESEISDIDDELIIAARTYVGICLVDAAKSIFEHDALVERLNNWTL